MDAHLNEYTTRSYRRVETDLQRNLPQLEEGTSVPSRQRRGPPPLLPQRRTPPPRPILSEQGYRDMMAQAARAEAATRFERGLGA